MVASTQPAVIGLDWGTTSLRGYLMAADGGILDTAVKPWGIRNLPAGGFVAALRGLAGVWHARDSTLPIVAAGMVGSRHGWREVPSVECPADASTMARGLLAFASEAGRIDLVPGVVQRGRLPNVLRGEETQIVGAVAREPGLAADSLLVLPGTHSKWVRVRVRDGRIVCFETFMTGELFAVLREHSLLGTPAREDAGDPVDAAVMSAAFARGLAVARESGPAAAVGDRARIGAGTVLSVRQVRDVAAAGGTLVVSPNANPDVIRATKAAGLWSAPGVATPTEGFAALEAGADMLKLFPAEQLGPGVVKAWRAVFPRDVPLVPVGGVTIETMRAFVAAGATGFGLGSALYTPGMTAAGARQAGDAFVSAWRACRPT